VGVKVTQPGFIVGTALEPLAEGSGKILVFINSTWYSPAGVVTRDEGASSSRGVQGEKGDATAGGTTVVGQAGAPVAVGAGIDVLRTIGESLAGFQPVNGPVEMGDVLVADRTYEGWMRRSEMGADPAVVAIVTGTDGMVLGDSLDRFAELDEQLFAELEAAARASADDGALQRWRPGCGSSSKKPSPRWPCPASCAARWTPAVPPSASAIC